MTGDAPHRVTPRRRRLLVGAALAVVLVAAGAATVRSGAAPEPSANRAAPGGATVQDAQAQAPMIGFERFNGERVQLRDWHGSPVVVNFWASWCPPCVAEMRDAFEPLHQQLGDRIVVLGVAMQDTPAAAQDVVERTGVTYELAADPDGALFTAFGGFGMPTTVLVDTEGRVVAHHTGALTRRELDGLVRTHLPGG